MNYKSSLWVRRTAALLVCLCCMTGSALAAEANSETAVQPASSPIQQLFAPLAQLFQQALQSGESTAVETVSENAGVGQLTTVVNSQAATAYFPTYMKKVSYNASAAVPAVALPHSSYLGEYKISFYCACSKCCGRHADGYTATGARAFEGRTIAVDRRKIPLGSKIYIEGMGDFIAEDVGSAITGNKIDVYVSSHSKACQLGIIKATSVYLMK